MRFSPSLALLALPVLGCVASNTPVSPTKEPQPVYQNAQEAFRDLLNALPEESLHAALHDLAPFKDGVFESDRHGVERVHRENPPLATKLIVAAVQDLKRRQNPPPTNGTATPPPSQTPTPSQTPLPPPTSDEPPTSEEPQEPSSTTTPQPPPIQVPVTVTQTNDKGETTTVSSDILSEPTASAVVTSTRTNEDGKTEVVTETKPAIVLTATDSAGKTFETTSAVDFAPTPGQKLTKTDSKGSVFVTTYTPDGGRVSSVKLITTTGPDGQPSVVTSYTYVEPAQQTGGEPQPTQSGARPGLQTGAAQINAVDAIMMGGALFAGLWI